MSLPTIIAVCGYKGSGKDTIAKYLEEKYDYTHIKITKPLKDCVQNLFNLTEEQIEKNKEQIDKRYGVSPRQLYQFFGTEIMQYQIQQIIPTMSKKFWINRFIDEYFNKTNVKYIISDLRFLHEYEELKKYNCEFWLVESNHVITNDKHISENEYKKIPVNYTIKNTKDIEYLYLQIDNRLAVVK